MERVVILGEQAHRYARLAAYCDELKRALRGTACVYLGTTPEAVADLRARLIDLLASDPRNPEKLEARARHDSFVAAPRSESPQDTIVPDASSGVYDEESWR